MQPDSFAPDPKKLMPTESSQTRRNETNQVMTEFVLFPVLFFPAFFENLICSFPCLLHTARTLSVSPIKEKRMKKSHRRKQHQQRFRSRDAFAFVLQILLFFLFQHRLESRKTPTRYKRAHSDPTLVQETRVGEQSKQKRT